MKVLLDACVLFPSVTRAVLLSVAETGAFEPLWSARILEEWSRAAARYGEGERAQAAAEMQSRRWPRAEVRPRPGTEARLWLPDPNDIHVLAAAIDGSADRLVTFNLRDFPKRELFGYGIRAQNPDAFLYDLWLQTPAPISAAVALVHAQAERRAGQGIAQRALLKRAKLPRLGKALA